MTPEVLPTLYERGSDIDANHHRRAKPSDQPRIILQRIDRGTIPAQDDRLHAQLGAGETGQSFRIFDRPMQPVGTI